MYFHSVCLLVLLNVVRGQSGNASTLLVDPDVYPGASQACLDALTQAPRCNPLVYALYSSYYIYMDLDTITNVCRDTCFSDIRTHAANVTSACSGVQYYDEPSDSYYPPDLLDLQAMSALNVTCIKNAGQYCETYFQNSTTQQNCDFCWLKLGQTQLDVALDGVDTDAASSFSSLTKSCGSTQFQTTTPTPVVLTAAPDPTPTCAGTQYAVQPGDTLESVSIAQKVATDTLLNRNGLSYDGFPANGTLCIEGTCTVYVVKTNDTCQGIASASNITTTQLLSWNTNINPLCNNLANFVNSTFCVSNPLGNYAMPTNTIGGADGVATTPAPIPANVGTNTTSDCGQFYEIQDNDSCDSVSAKFGIALNDFYFLNPEINSTCGNLQLGVSYCVQPVGVISTYPGYGMPSTTPIQPASTTSLAYTPFASQFPNPTKAVTIPLANGTRSDCISYVQVQNSTGLDCWAWAKAYGISDEELVLWNPSLSDVTDGSGVPPSSYNYSCTLSPSASFCLGLVYQTAGPAPTTAPPSPIAAGQIADCDDWYLPVDNGYTCEDLLRDTDMTIDQFYKMNPGVGPDCTGMSLGTYYCVDSPSVNGDGTTTTSLPPIGSGSTTTSSPTSTTAPNGVTTPSPIQSGMITSCNKFHKVVQNEGCYDLAAANSISLDDFYAWNPALNGDCSGLFPDYYVCVGIIASSSGAPTSTSTTPPTTTSSTAGATPTPHQPNMIANCKQFYQDQANDYCYTIAAKFNISTDQFIQYNPDVGTDCGFLEPDVWYCVAI